MFKLTPVGLACITGTHYKFTEEDIKELIAEASSLVKEALQYPSPPAPSQASVGHVGYHICDLVPVYCY